MYLKRMLVGTQYCKKIVVRPLEGPRSIVKIFGRTAGRSVFYFLYRAIMHLMLSGARAQSVSCTDALMHTQTVVLHLSRSHNFQQQTHRTGLEIFRTVAFK